MLALYITVPLMILAVVIAVIPVLRGSLRHHRAMEQGELETDRSASREADFWHRMLGHRAKPGIVPTPDLIDDSEVIRVGAPAGDRVEFESGQSGWRSPS
jgi:hypothetical protein